MPDRRHAVRLVIDAPAMTEEWLPSARRVSGEGRDSWRSSKLLLSRAFWKSRRRNTPGDLVSLCHPGRRWEPGHRSEHWGLRRLLAFGRQPSPRGFTWKSTLPKRLLRSRRGVSEGMYFLNAFAPGESTYVVPGVQFLEVRARSGSDSGQTVARYIVMP